MTWVKLYFQVFKQILITTTAVNIVVNGIISHNIVLFLSMLFWMLFVTIIIFVFAILYFWLRYELPQKVKIFILRLKLFWGFMNFTEGELKIFELFVDKVNESCERGKKE